jgi:hypothetical protein
MLEQCFTVMVVIYVLFAVYMSVYGNFYKMICKTYIRWILNDCIGVALESAIIIPIMYLHHKCA